MTRQRWVLALAPLLVALAVTAGIVWTRGDPARQGGLCARTTAEVTGLLRRTERSGNLDRDQADHLAEALGRLDLLDEDRLTEGLPAALAPAGGVVRRELPAHRRAVEAAEREGRERPQPPTALRSAVAELLAAYYDTCI